MYGGGHRHGLGAPTLPAGVDPVTGANDPWFTLAVQLGGEPDSVAGFDDYYNAHVAFTTGGRKAITLANPILAAVIASGIGVAQSNVGAFGEQLPASQQPSAAEIIARMVQVDGPTADSNQAYAIWPDLPASVASAYRAAVTQAVPILLQQGIVTASGIADPNQQQEASDAFLQALKTGPVVTTTEGGAVIPVSYVVSGPTRLSDGTMTLTYRDVFANVPGYTGPPTHTITWRPAAAATTVTAPAPLYPPPTAPAAPATPTTTLSPSMTVQPVLYAPVPTIAPPVIPIQPQNRLSPPLYQSPVPDAAPAPVTAPPDDTGLWIGVGLVGLAVAGYVTRRRGRRR